MKREGQRIFTVAVDVSAGVEEYASILPPASLARVADGQGDTAGRDGRLKPDWITEEKKRETAMESGFSLFMCRSGERATAAKSERYGEPHRVTHCAAA